jgi:Ca-activated chloride channel family protein
MMTNTAFANPEFLWLLLLLPIAIVWYYMKQKSQVAHLNISTISPISNKGFGLVQWRHLLFVLRLLALALIILGLARPRSFDVTARNKKNLGIDIVLSIDVSGSMLARDFKPNRLEALKKVASEFVFNRVNDRLGVVVYAAESYTKTPVTSDKPMILESIKTIKWDRILQDGTGIGMGLSTAVNRLKDSKAKSKVIILLTDGVNNSGFIEPETAADIAKEFGIKVYTIGVGSIGMADSPFALDERGNIMYKRMPVEIDEKLLKNIANKTGGQYFRATDNSSLKKIYNEIDQLERTELDEKTFYSYDEKFRPLILLALGLLLLEFTLRNTLFRSFI